MLTARLPGAFKATRVVAGDFWALSGVEVETLSFYVIY